MCGIAGIIDPYQTIAPETLRARLQEMAKRLVHRGPDDHGAWLSPTHSLGFAHQRLSIIDLSKEGHQPMISENGEHALVYNGEIYNAPEIRETLSKKGHRFRGHSDTEVVLKAMIEWGVEKSLSQFSGMFALGFWSKNDETLTLARDRVGEKPLYCLQLEKHFLFASEIKAFPKLSGWNRALNPQAIEAYLHKGYIPAPLSIYQDITKIEPGQLREIKVRNGQSLVHTTRSYWTPQPGRVKTATPDDLETIFEEKLKTIIRRQKIADVPVGTFLSGGLDSSLVTALMQEASSVPVKTFTIGFEDAGYDESEHAAKIAKQLGTDHHEIRLNLDEALRIIPELSKTWDEPFGDSSQVPTYLISQVARRKVKVCLTGDGGDEVFLGYNRYIWAPKVWNRSRLLPPVARNLLSYGIRNSRSIMRTLLRNHPQPVEKAYKLSQVLRCANQADIYQFLSSVWPNPPIPPTAKKLRGKPTDPIYKESFVRWMQLQDLNEYLPGDILTKVDRASMAHSLETRIPFLDHELIELALSTPQEHHLIGGAGKQMIRKLLARRFSKNLFDRPKAGFALPIARWLREDLRDWVEPLLAERRMNDAGYLNTERVRNSWNRFLNGADEKVHQIWSVVQFQAWLAGNDAS